MEPSASDAEQLVHLFFEAGCLRSTLRTHYRRLFTQDFSDNLAAHSFRVGFIAFFLAQMEGCDPFRAAVMGMVHDLPETRTGDLGFVEKAYVFEEEERTAREQLEGIPLGADLLAILLEQQAKETLLAQIVADADRLDELLLLKEHAHQGNQEALAWLRLDDFDHWLKRFHTAGAKVLAQEIVSQNISDWWINLGRSDKRKK